MKFNINLPAPLAQYIVCSSDEALRYNASSGAAISTLIKYLFDMKKIDAALSFKFNRTRLFEPRFIYSFEQYELTGSIYHQVPILKFIKNNVDKIKGCIVVTCLPCQVLPIRHILNKHNISSYIISMTCSLQLTKQATFFLFRKLDQDPDNMVSFRYRGNGWPGGIQISTEGRDIFIPNNNSIWSDIFHSFFFTLRKCFACTDTFGKYADISVADPWIKRYVENEKKGASTVLPFTARGYELLLEAIRSNRLTVLEELQFQEVLLSQLPTIRRKRFFKKHTSIVKHLIALVRDKSYFKFVVQFDLLHIHTVSINKLIRLLIRLTGG